MEQVQWFGNKKRTRRKSSGTGTGKETNVVDASVRYYVSARPGVVVGPGAGPGEAVTGAFDMLGPMPTLMDSPLEAVHKFMILSCDDAMFLPQGDHATAVTGDSSSCW